MGKDYNKLFGQSIKKKKRLIGEMVKCQISGKLKWSVHIFLRVLHLYKFPHPPKRPTLIERCPPTHLNLIFVVLCVFTPLLGQFIMFP